MNNDGTYPGQSAEFPLGHLIPHVLSASSHDVPQKKVNAGSSGSCVGLSAVKKYVSIFLVEPYMKDFKLYQ